MASAVKCHPEFALQSNPEFDSAEYNKPLPSVGFDTNYSVPVLHNLSNSDLELDHCATWNPFSTLINLDQVFYLVIKFWIDLQSGLLEFFLVIRPEGILTED